jgi:RNA polymerase sigma-70 factor (ECF subfamily)
MKGGAGSGPVVPDDRFPTTRWSMIVDAGAGPAPAAQAALALLCRQYWYPLYAFVRRQGRSHHEAEDCTQEFLTRLLASDGVAQARPERGRFRTFLLTSLRNFLTNEWRRTQAAKRGGGQAAVSLEGAQADARFAAEPIDPGLSPEQAFDCNWAHGLIQCALGELRLEYGKNGRAALFAALSPLVWENPGDESFAACAAPLGLTAAAFTVALHRLRRRFGERLRAIVGETVTDGADLDAELRHLVAAFGRSPPAA